MKIYMVDIIPHRIAYGATSETPLPKRSGLFLSISDAKNIVAEYLGLEKKDIKWKKSGRDYVTNIISEGKCWNYVIVLVEYENGKLMPY